MSDPKQPFGTILGTTFVTLAEDRAIAMGIIAAAQEKDQREWYDRVKAEGWTYDNGFFWLYYNTRQGRPPTRKQMDVDVEKWSKSPWIVRQFKSRQCYEVNYPRLGTFEDHFAKEVRGAPAPSLGVRFLETVYEEDPVWRHQKTSLQSVRGFLRVEGVLMWR